MKDKQKKLYGEQHERTFLEEEKQRVGKALGEFRTENAALAREISRNKMFNKKDEERRYKKEEIDKVLATINE